jgi:steroid 5-alpha reductase family enzyme
MLSIWLQGWLLVAALFFALWLVERKQNDASLVDAGWAGSLGGLAFFYAALGPGLFERRLLMGMLVGAWAFRLAGYIVLRHRGSEEDGRYQEIRANWKDEAHRFFFFFYQAQGLLAALLSLPFLLIAFDESPSIHALEVAGIALAAMAFVLESVADRQLAGHRRDPENKGKTCRRGLWRYSRHPNYFFEWLIWVGYAVAALRAPYGFTALASPLLMLYLILKVTGIPPTEERALRSRGEDYRRYQRTTSAFVPWFPKEEASP